MGIPVKMSDDEYVRVMYAKVSKGIPLYRHIQPDRLLNARWMLYDNFLWVSDFGGLCIDHKIVFPHVAVWGKSKVLIYNRHLYAKNYNLNVYVPSVTYKMFAGFPEQNILSKSNIIIDFYNGLFWDCRVENLSLKKDEEYGVGYDDF